MNAFKVQNERTANDNVGVQRRRHPRRSQDVCMVSVDGHPHPVLDWSLCGVLFEGDDGFYIKGQQVSLIMRFKVGQGVEDVKLTGHIVRINNRHIAIQFDDLEKSAELSLYKVIENTQ